MKSNTSGRFLVTVVGHLAIVAGAAFVALWLKGGANLRLLVGGIASLVLGAGLVALMARASLPPNSR